MTKDLKPYLVAAVFKESNTTNLRHGVYMGLTKEDALGRFILEEQPENTHIICRSVMPLDVEQYNQDENQLKEYKDSDWLIWLEDHMNNLEVVDAGVIKKSVKIWEKLLSWFLKKKGYTGFICDSAATMYINLKWKNK